ncbi:hypothetical protein [Arthrobacter bambusae]|uniref:Flagellar protein FliT n=2 Tax=Arthrobacter TaxID=1663 RepID=A0AAW8DLY7_9MICC|nr:hypothetical protein [Arthrobacter bambusae]MDP9907169.1 hypothetical protein [Arthrobacter bambusae]MDQ0131344.1 hypothetical protein [Arthrobacter bambusae]MDQ0182677.1 hypothetical protein [Arthrobacter bambusae]
MSADPVQAWSGILDRLEADIALAVSGGEPEAWNPPAADEAGPLPEELADTARRILDAQLESMAMLGKVRNDALAHLDALSTVPDSQSSARPLFLDVQG